MRRRYIIYIFIYENYLYFEFRKKRKIQDYIQWKYIKQRWNHKTRISNPKMFNNKTRRFLNERWENRG